MRHISLLAVFMLATLSWVVAQQPGSSPQPSAGQTTSPSSQPPAAGQSQSSVPGSAGQASPQTGAQGGQSQAASKPVTEGCLGGSAPNFTVTDKSGTIYKLNLPPNANASSLTPHVGESVLVMGDVTAAGGPGKASSIDVMKIGRGNGNCSGSSSKPPTNP